VWAPEGASLLVEIRSGERDDALVVALCGRCGVEVARAQTDTPRALVLAESLAGRVLLEDRLAAGVVVRLRSKRCRCGQPLPGRTVAMRIEVIDEEEHDE
jgi:hypothetical protein